MAIPYHGEQMGLQAHMLESDPQICNSHKKKKAW